MAATPEHFPYVAAVIATAAVGALASGVRAAQAPARAMALEASVYVPRATVPAVQAPPVVVGSNLGAAVAKPVQVGTPPFAAASPFVSAQMNQPGEPPFIEGFSGNQGVGSTMNQPGQPDFYEGFGFNHGVVAPNAGAQPTTQSPGVPGAGAAAQPESAAPPGEAPAASPGVRIVTPSVGFYNGFGSGRPDYGFYAGFTTPR